LSSRPSSSMTAEACSGRIFGTTADIGLNIRADSLPTLYSCAGETLFSAVCDRRRVREISSMRVEVRGEDREDLLLAWLNELVYIIDTHHFLARRCRVTLGKGLHLTAQIRGETFIEGRHLINAEIKAATYHGLRVWRENDTWRARVILDV
jgi:SHS2 domain-containing protein